MSAAFLSEKREMHERRAEAIRRGVIMVIDIGSSKMSAMIIRFTPVSESEDRSVRLSKRAKSFRVLGSAQVPARGVKDGEIVSLGAAEGCLLHLVSQVQKNAGVRADHAVVCYAGGNPVSHAAYGETTVKDGEVSAQDIAAALGNCQLPECAENREIIHAMPVNFVLDQRSELLDPRGLLGSRLGVDLHVVETSSGAMYNLKQILRRAGIDIVGVSLSSHTSGLAVLTEDEQQLGAAIVDMGGGSTSMSMFFRKQLICVDAARIGGRHVTQDIAHGLRVETREAERLKALHAGTEITAADDRDFIEIRDEISTGAPRHITRAELISIVRPRLEEILEEVREMLPHDIFSALPSQRVVLTGGGSQIPGLEALAESILGYQVRIGPPLRLAGLSETHTGAGFASLTGLALQTAMPHDEMWDFDLPTTRSRQRQFKNVLNWFRENW